MPSARSAKQTKFVDAPIVAGERSGGLPELPATRERVDMVDLVGHTVHMSCAACGTHVADPAPRPLTN